MKRSSLLVPVVVAALVCGIVVARWSQQPIDAYGELGAEWIEHFERVRAAQMWGYDRGGPLDLLVATDGAYPPLLHVLTLPAGLAVGLDHPALNLLGLLWYLLLAGAVGLLARGLVPDEPTTVAAATVAALLLPAAHAAAPRYYYDLPMTALLWSSAAVVVNLGPKRPVVAGLTAGLVAAAAALVKWSAIAFAGPMLLGAVLVVRVARKDRLLLVVALVVGFAVPTGGFLSQSTRSWTEMMGTFGPSEDPAGAVAEAARRTATLDPHLQPPDRSERSGGRIERTGYYLRGLARAVWSPILTLLMIPLAVLAAIRRRPGAVFVALTIGGQGAFVILSVPPLDERFVLSLAPAVPLAAALGWSTLAGRWRAGVAAAFVVAGLWVAADFHLATDADFDPRSTVGVEEPSAGLGLTGSWEQRGWGRADRRRDVRRDYRERLWAAVESARAQRVGIIGGPLIDPFGDTNWWRYRALLGEVEGTWGRQGGIELIDLCGSGEPPDVDVVLASDTRITPLDQPWCPAAGEWGPGMKIQGSGTHPGAVVWRHPDDPDEGR